jgi:hypothetical protein
MTIFIQPYKKGSRGAMALRTALFSRGQRTLISYRAPLSREALIVNWGNSAPGYDPTPFKNVINHPGLLGLMTNKLRFFNRTGHDEMVPRWSTEAAEAERWGGKVLARKILEGSGGAGIEVWEPGPVTIPKAPLYVQYENKTHEYRIHMARSLRGTTDFEPILVQRKIFQKSEGNPAPKSWEVRNHANGFVFVRESGYPTPDKVLEIARNFMNKFFAGLHFCALDVIYHEKKNRAWVLEGNTAPGLEGNTVDVYADYIQGLAKEAGQ